MCKSGIFYGHAWLLEGISLRRWWSGFTSTVCGWVANTTKNVGYSWATLQNLGCQCRGARFLVATGNKLDLFPDEKVCVWFKTQLTLFSFIEPSFFTHSEPPPFCGYPFGKVSGLLAIPKESGRGSAPRCGWDGLPHQAIPPHHGAGWEFPAGLPENPRQPRGAPHGLRGNSNSWNRTNKQICIYI